ncbi:MAG: segregation/condensation protein A [Rickettsiella sp.]|nr:segregation/condensation protein A [Rickettsiella sp.]
MIEETTLSTTATVLPPVATVRGQPFVQLPSDLYIPPQALEVLLETFTGPLDLLLYLIKKQNFDILDIPVAEVTRQYMHYIELMQVLEIELATEYLVMAAVLTEIKSRLLLPKPVSVQSVEEEDPRVELIRRLQEYEQVKQAAYELDQLPRQGRDVFLAMAKAELTTSEINGIAQPDIDLEDLIEAFQSVLMRTALTTHHAIAREPLSIRERMSQIMHRLSAETCVEFTTLFTAREGRMGVVVTFIALLELWRQTLIELLQKTPFGKIEVSAR